MTGMLAALGKVQGGVPITQVSEEFNIPSRTLYDKAKKGTAAALVQSNIIGKQGQD